MAYSKPLNANKYLNAMKDNQWLHGAIIYHVLIDRFYAGRQSVFRNQVFSCGDQIPPKFCGGNLQGIAEKIDYLLDLGINTIWLSPFTKTCAYHGYHVTDFNQIEQRFGGEIGFQTLVKVAKTHGIRLIMDFVPNHIHNSHRWFVAAKNDRRSRYRDWFYWQPNGKCLNFLDVSELPKLNLDHPKVRAEIIDAAKYWLDQGIDGFRLDHAIGPSLGFWREFRSQLKRHNKNVALIGEVAFGIKDEELLNTIALPNKKYYFTAESNGFDVLDDTMLEYVDVFDGLLDFKFQNILKGFVAHAKWSITKNKIQRMLDCHYARFPEQCCLLSFLDNHDTDRFLFEANDDKTRLKKAIEIQFAQRHPPVIYYGTEIGMSQSRTIKNEHYGDRHARQIMAWQWEDNNIFNVYKRVINKRKLLHSH